MLDPGELIERARILVWTGLAVDDGLHAEIGVEAHETIPHVSVRRHIARWNHARQLTTDLTRAGLSRLPISPLPWLGMATGQSPDVLAGYQPSGGVTLAGQPSGVVRRNMAMTSGSS